MVHTMIELMCALFIVSHVNGTMSFYTGEPGFKSSYKGPEEDPFFAIVGPTGLRLLSRPAKPRRSPAPTAIRR